MNRIFSLDSPLSKLLSTIADLVLLNICFIVFSLPVLTIGSSLTAMHFVTLQMVKDEQTSVLSSFYKSFKQNLRKATSLWLVVVTAWVILFAWYIVIDNLVALNVAFVLRIILYLLIALWGMTSLYVFFLQAKFENSLKETLKNAFLMSIRHLLTTFLSLVVIGAVVILLVFYPKVTGYGMFLVFVGFALVSYAISWLMSRVFQRYVD